MDDSRLTNVTQLRQFLKGAQGLDVSLRTAGIKQRYGFIDRTVDRLKYQRLDWKGKRPVLNYLRKITGYRKAQLFRLVKRAVAGKLSPRQYHRIKPHRIYTVSDIKLLEQTDEHHLRLSAPATQEILRREVEVFKHREYQTIAKVSWSHLNNLRSSPAYRNSWVNHTKPRLIPIGITSPPENFGLPGSLRIDTVHQRDVYHINAVDEITQWEVLVCVPAISEQFLLPAINQILGQCPFIVFGIHADRGCEYINYLVVELLTKLFIKLTKSRSGHPNDNALVETKNGSVVRKNMGWEHLDNGASDLINGFYQNWFNPYLNYHRPCGYPTLVTDDKGKTKRIYHSYQPPYEALKAIRGGRKFLKPGESFAKLDILAYQYSDNEFAKQMRQEQRKLFDTIQTDRSLQR